MTDIQCVPLELATIHYLQRVRDFSKTFFFVYSTPKALHPDMQYFKVSFSRAYYDNKSDLKNDEGILVIF